MSKKANPTLVGTFVLVGVLILIAAILILGSGRLFSRPVRLVMHFNDSVNGLVVGAPVKFKGVQIGRVERIMIQAGLEPENTFVPVIAAIERDSFSERVEHSFDISNPKFLDELIKRGLRATLETESFITGRLFVSLDMHPGEPPAEILGNTRYPEIPTKSTGLVKFIENLSQLDLVGMAAKLDAILDKLNNSLSELNIKDLNSRMAEVLDSINNVAKSPKLIETIESFRKTSDRAETLMSKLEAELDPISQGLQSSIIEASETFIELQQAADLLQALLSNESPVMFELQQSLRDVSTAARAFRQFADDLSRNPDMLLKGKAETP